MAKVILPLAEGFEEIEALATADVLRRAGIEVVLAGIPGTIVTGSKGIKLIADTKIEDVNPNEFDALVLPGGNPGYINLGRSQKVLDMIADFNEKEKLLCAICASPSILARLGVLDNRKATIYPGMEREIPRPRSGKVVVDGHVITSEGPGTAIDFALEIVRQLVGKEKAEEVKKQIVYKC